MPQAMMPAPAMRQTPRRSFSSTQPINAANNTEVSLSAATAAIGTVNMAHSAIE